MAALDETVTPKMIFEEGAAPATPASGTVVIYPKTDGLMYQKDDAGTETQMGPGSGGIPGTIGDAKGDLIGFSAADTPARQAAGADGTVLVYDAAQTNGLKGVQPFGQTQNYRRVFANDVINGSSATPFADVAAFDTKEVLNSRILHLRTLGASKDQRVRVTLGTTKAAAFDVTVCIVWNGQRWSTSMDTYGEVRLSTSADAQIAVARVGMQASVTDWGMRVGGSSISTANDTLEPRFHLGQAITLRFVRDGSNVISYSFGLGTAPMALVPIVGFNVGGVDIPYTQTVSGTLARIEFAQHTPSGPNASAAVDMYVDYLASV